ncbi:MAG TPA: alkaline phosphatase family protein [Bryobacteraceae bacterium]|nr:alkaline phosphatase family protein [Bryobacteraceae bacterium]
MTPSAVSVGTRPVLQDLAFCVSFAHLFFLKYWDEVLDHSVSYHVKTPSSYFLPAVTILTTLAMAAVFFAILRALRRIGNKRIHRAAGIVFVVCLVLFPVNTVRKHFLHLGFVGLTSEWNIAARVAVVSAIVLAAGWIVLRYERAIVRGARAAVLILVLLLPFTVSTTAWQTLRQDPAVFEDQPVSPRLENAAGRMVIIVFDELDRGLAAPGARPPGIELPALDRLETQALHATRASSPALDTLDSIPGLVTGRQVTKSSPRSPGVLLIRHKNADTDVDWKQEPSLFSRARNARLNVGIAGWYHPYCRLFGRYTADCFWAPAAGVLHREESIGNLNVVEAASVQFRRAILQAPVLSRLTFLAPRTGLLHPDVRRQERLRTREEYLGVHGNALRMVADAGLHLVYLHYPVPHSLTIYDRKTKDFTARDGVNYSDNLLLVDRTVSELRSALETAGLWEKTAILLTSDHPMRVPMYQTNPEWDAEQASALTRAPERYVPFVLKLAGQTEGLKYTNPLGTVATSDLTSAILSRQVTTANDAASWLAQFQPSP